MFYVDLTFYYLVSLIELACFETDYKLNGYKSHLSCQYFGYISAVLCYQMPYPHHPVKTNQSLIRFYGIGIDHTWTFGPFCTLVEWHKWDSSGQASQQHTARLQGVVDQNGTAILHQLS